MKLHLPKLLRNAVLACITAVAGISTTVGTAAITAGVASFALTNATARAEQVTYTSTITSHGSNVATFQNDADTSVTLSGSGVDLSDLGDSVTNIEFSGTATGDQNIASYETNGGYGGRVIFSAGNAGIGSLTSVTLNSGIEANLKNLQDKAGFLVVADNASIYGENKSSSTYRFASDFEIGAGGMRINGDSNNANLFTGTIKGNGTIYLHAGSSTTGDIFEGDVSQFEGAWSRTSYSGSALPLKFGTGAACAGAAVGGTIGSVDNKLADVQFNYTGAYQVKGAAYVEALSVLGGNATFAEDVSADTLSVSGGNATFSKGLTITVEGSNDGILTLNGSTSFGCTLSNTGTVKMNGTVTTTEGLQLNYDLAQYTSSIPETSTEVLTPSLDGNGYRYGNEYLLVSGGEVELGTGFSYTGAGSVELVEGVGLLVRMPDAEADPTTYYVNKGTVTFAEGMVTDALTDIRMAEGTTLRVTLGNQNLSNVTVTLDGDATLSLDSSAKTAKAIVCENARLNLASSGTGKYLVINGGTFTNATLDVSAKGVQIGKNATVNNLDVILSGTEDKNYLLANGALTIRNLTMSGGRKELCASNALTVSGTVSGDGSVIKTGGSTLTFNGNVYLAGGFESNNSSGSTRVNNIMTVGGPIVMSNGSVVLGENGSIVVSSVDNLTSSDITTNGLYTQAYTLVTGTVANLKKADDTAVDTITYAGNTYTLTGGKFSVADVYYAVENGKTVTVGGSSGATENTSNAKAFVVNNGATIKVAGATTALDTAAKVLQAISGTGEVVLATDAQILANQTLGFAGNLTVNSGVTLTLGPTNDNSSRNTMRFPSLSSIKLNGGTLQGSYGDTVVSRIESVASGSSIKLHDLSADAFNGGDTFRIDKLAVGGALTIYTQWKHNVDIGQVTGSADLTLEGRRESTQPTVGLRVNIDSLGGFKGNLILKNAKGSLYEINATLKYGETFDSSRLQAGTNCSLSLSGAGTYNLGSTASLNGAVLAEDWIGTVSLTNASITSAVDASSFTTAASALAIQGLSVTGEGALTLDGTVSLGGAVTLESSIANGGALTFGPDLQLDLTGMTATDGAGGTKVITLLTGAGTSNLASLTDSVLTAATKELGTNWTFNADGTISYMIGSTVSDLYWESGSGNWSDAKWSTTDGATSGQTTLPTSGTVNVVFNNNNETASISIGSGASVNNMSVTAGTYTFTGDTAATLDVAGTLTVGSGATANIETAVEVGSIEVAGTLGISQSIKVAENGTVTLDAAGTINLQDFEPTSSTTNFVDSMNAFGTTINTYKVFDGGSISGTIGTWQIDGATTTDGTFHEDTGEYTIPAVGKIYGVGNGTVNLSSATGLGAKGVALNGGTLVLDAAPTEAGFITATDKGGTLDLNGKTVAQSALGVLDGATVLEGNAASIYDLGAEKALASNLSLSNTNWKGTVKMGDIATPTEELDISSLGCPDLLSINTDPSSIKMGAVSVKKLTSSSAARVQADSLTLGAASEVSGDLTLTSGTLTLGSADASLTAARLITSGSLTIAAVSQDVLDALNTKASQGEIPILTFTEEGFTGNLTQEEIVVPTRAAAPVEKYFTELQWNATKTQLSYVSRVNPDYVGALVEASTQNGLAGVALLQQALQQVNPQVTAPDSALAAVLNAVDAGELSEEGAAAVAGAATAVLGMAAHGDLDRQLQAIRNRTTIMGVDQSVVHHDMPYFNAWINAEGDYSELSDDGTEGGYKLNSWGGTVGFDVDITPTFTAGMALTAMYGDLSVTGADSASGDLNTYYVSAFARYCASAWTHTFVATAGLSDITLDRTVMGEEINGETDGVSFGLMYEVGRVFALDEDGTACLQPIFNVTWRHTSVSGYTEDGSDLALDVDDQTLDTITFGVGARLQAIVGESMYNRTSIFECRLLAKFDAGDRRGSSDVALAALGGDSQEVESAERGPIGLEAGAGLTIPLGDEGGSLFMDAAIELRADYTNVNGTVGYRINF